MMLNVKKLRSLRILNESSNYVFFEFVYYSNYHNYLIIDSLTGRILYRYLSYSWAVRKFNKLSYNL